MLRTDLNTIAAMTDAQIALLTCVNLADIQAMLAQKDKANADLAAANTANAQAVATTASANTKALADKDAANAAIVAPLQAQLTSLTTQLSVVSGQAATLTQQSVAATASLQAAQAQLAGVAGSYQVPVTGAQEIALEIEAQRLGTIPAAVVLSLWTPAINTLGNSHADTIFAAAMAKYPTLSPADQGAMLTALGFQSLIGVALADQMPYLQAMALDRFLALPVAVQNGLLAKLGV